MAPWSLFNGYPWSSPMSQHFRFDASRSLTALEQDSTIVAVIEMSQAKWLVAALVPGIERQPQAHHEPNRDRHQETAGHANERRTFVRMSSSRLVRMEIGECQKCLKTLERVKGI